VRALSVVWAPKPWTTAAAGASYAVAIAAGATLPGMVLIQVAFFASWLSAPRRRGSPGGGGGEAAEGARPLLPEGAGAGGPVLARAVVDAAAGSGTLLVPNAKAGGEGEARRLHLGRPELARLLGIWLAGLRQLPADGGDGSPLQVGCYAMGPEGMLSEARLLCLELNAGRGGAKFGGASGGGASGAAGARGVFMRFAQRTHNL
jgi:hypothetical protein